LLKGDHQTTESTLAFHPSTALLSPGFYLSFLLVLMVS